MKAAASTLIATILGATVLMPPTDATAASVKVTAAHLHGPLINASFSAPDPSDPSGCVNVDAFVSANSDTSHLGSTTQPDGVASVSIDAYDSCTGETVFQAVGQVDISQTPGAFVVSNQYDHATLNATIPVTDIDTGAISQAIVDVTVTGTSDLHRDHENTNDIYSRSCHVLNRWKGTGRDAVASGTVWDGGRNYTPAPSQNAEIGWVVDGFQVIGCSD